jgi:hypothetical protein
MIQAMNDRPFTQTVAGAICVAAVAGLIVVAIQKQLFENPSSPSPSATRNGGNPSTSAAPGATRQAPSVENGSGPSPSTATKEVRGAEDKSNRSPAVQPPVASTPPKKSINQPLGFSKAELRDLVDSEKYVKDYVAYRRRTGLCGAWVVPVVLSGLKLVVNGEPIGKNHPTMPRECPPVTLTEDAPCEVVERAVASGLAIAGGVRSDCSQ